MLNSVAQVWLGLQCRQITGASQGLVVLDGVDGKPAPAAVWPEGSVLGQVLVKTAQRAWQQRRDLILELRANPEADRTDSHQIACLLEIKGEVAGVVALQVRSGSAQPQSLLRLLKWGAAWFQLLMEYAESSRNRQLGAALELVATSIEGKRLLQGAIAVATQLAARWQCEQVAIGLSDAGDRHVSVQVLSNNPRFDRRQNLIRAIARAMMEALDQAAVVSYPDSVGSLPIVVHAHEKLAQVQRCLCTVPMAQEQRSLGAITLIRSKDRPFVEVELTFKSDERGGVLGVILAHPVVAFVGIIFALSFVLYLLFVHRVLKHLDATTVVPKRVKVAFNSLSEGVLVLDAKHNVVPANSAFVDRVDCDADSLIGKNISKVSWQLKDSMGGDSRPWERVVNDGKSILGFGMTLITEQNLVRKFMVNSAVIHDGNGKVRGSLTTFDDVTALEPANQHLLETMNQLAASREQVEVQNEELKRLASRDPMTGCLNRRAFFETFERPFVEAQEQGSELSCIMADIDHFKSFNDTYGHAVGDQLIQVVASTLQAHFRSDDLLCGYGGEEFCIVFPGLQRVVVLEIADRIRSEIEQQAGCALRTTAGITVTSSFGVASLSGGAIDPVELIDQADQALYASKETGRNRVTCWPLKPAALEASAVRHFLEATG
jgi:diguanylate cyclase (GGDEF)-like protein